MDNKKPTKDLENWEIHHVFLDETMTVAAPVIKGFSEGKEIKNDILLWFDLEEEIAMTKDHIFKIGTPNERWMIMFLATGRRLDELEIKGVNH